MKPWLELLFGCVLGPIAIGVIASAFVILSAPQVQAAQCRGIVATASYYGTESGSRTATGEYFNGQSLTAAMPSRSHLGERWRVSYAGRSVVVRIDDIGPAAYLHRGIDLSRAAAEKIGLVRIGVATVCLERLG